MREAKRLRLITPCSNVFAWPSSAPTCARLFLWKEMGTSTTAAALIAHGFAAIPLVTIGVTNADVTSNSAVDDGAADQGMDCTSLTVRHAPGYRIAACTWLRIFRRWSRQPVLPPPAHR